MNNLNVFREKIASKRLCVGSIVTLSDPAISELNAEVGYDFTWIDLEHAPLGIEAALGHVMAARGTEMAPFIRVPGNEFNIIKPLLELAPAGIIIPMVNTKADALSAVQSCRYPPIGRRGCGPRRGMRFGAMPFEQYLRQSEHDPLIIVQIEDIAAMSELDEILAVEGIGSICVGPYDLSGSMGKLGQVDDPEVAAVIDEICRKTLAAGKMLGTATGFAPANVQHWIDRGIQWLALNSECNNHFIYSRQILDGVASIMMK